jgi:hypothetical protein
MREVAAAVTDLIRCRRAGHFQPPWPAFFVSGADAVSFGRRITAFAIGKLFICHSKPCEAFAATGFSYMKARNENTLTESHHDHAR